MENKGTPPVYVIAPDVGAGEDFTRTLTGEGINAVMHFARMDARVVHDPGTGKNIMNPDKDTVGKHIAGGAQAAIELHRSRYPDTPAVFTISCNTASLDAFMQPAFRELEQKGLKRGETFLFVSLIESVKEHYAEQNKPVPLVLGTEVLTGALTQEGFDTPQKRQREDLAALVQEIIWREKALETSVTGTAPDYGTPLNDETVFQKKMDTLIGEVEKSGSECILMCTELPNALARWQKANPDRQLQTSFVNPAFFVAEKMKKLGL